ncbi:MAG: response regulator [Candidatus Abyssubacteria bacterium]
MDQLRVLVVDDEEELVQTLVERLQLRNIDAEGVTTGSDAMERLQEREFDVVILDVKMPGIDGLDLLRRIKKLRPSLNVILLTGRGSARESEIGLEEGAFDYLVKPINIEDLIKRMKEAARTP